MPLPEKQLIIMFDTNEHAAGYVHLIEDYTDEEAGETNNFAPIALGSKRFTTGHISLAMYAKQISAIQLALDDFGPILWGTKKPIMVITDNKTLTSFFQAENIQPSFWIFCDQMLQFKFVLADVAGVQNPAADYLSHLQSTPEYRKHSKLTDSTPVS